MTFVQRIIDNDRDDLPGHVLIVGEQDGVEVWRSWAPEIVPIEARLNIDHPEAHDHRKGAPKGQKVRWKMPADDTFDALDDGPDNVSKRAVLKEAARSRGLNVEAEVKLRHDVKPGKPSPTA